MRAIQQQKQNGNFLLLYFHDTLVCVHGGNTPKERAVLWFEKYDWSENRIFWIIYIPHFFSKFDESQSFLFHNLKKLANVKLCVNLRIISLSHIRGDY